MKIKKLNIDHFRCFNNFCISFEDDITIIVGENDCGKTSLIDCLKVITQDRPIEEDDFQTGFEKIEISIEIDNFVYKKMYEKNGNSIHELPLEAYPTEKYLLTIKNEFESDTFDSTNPQNEIKIKETARIFNFTVRSNSNVDNLKSQIVSTINENIGNKDFKIEGSQFPRFNNIQLD